MKALRRGVSIALFSIGLCSLAAMVLRMPGHRELPAVVAAPPADVAAYIARAEACEAIAAKWGDDWQPVVEHGCGDLPSMAAVLQGRYAGQKLVLRYLNRPWRPVPVKRPRPAPPWMWGGQPSGAWWTPEDLDWHYAGGLDAPDAVAVIDNELVGTSGDGRTAQLTLDGVAKSDPVFSPDGQNIAFLEPVERRLGVGQIVIIDRLGHEVRRLNVQPPDPLIPQPSMIFGRPGVPIAWHSVARFQWLDGNRIVVQSSIAAENPRAFLILNSSTGAVLAAFTDSGSRVKFTQDGRHYFFQAGVPLGYMCTCQPDPRRNPNPVSFRTDEGVVSIPGYPWVDLSVGPVWSADGNTLFLIASGWNIAPRIFAWSGGHATLLDGPPLKSAADMYEGNGDLIVVDNVRDGTKYRRQTWKFARGRPPAAAVDNVYDWSKPGYWARQHREWLEKAVARVRPDARMPDFWCKDCNLTVLPRMSSPPHGPYEK